MSKRIAITGASGHLGTALLEPLLDKGYSLKAHYRSLVPPITHDNLDWIQGSITDTHFLTELFTDCDVVIHSAGMISLNKSHNDEVFNTNITGTERVIEAVLSHNNIKLIHISSTNAVRDIAQKTVFNENSPLRTSKERAYGYSKAKSERLVLEAIGSKQLNAIIIRPSALIGPPDHRPSLLGQSILDLINKKIPALPSGGYNYVDVRDVADSIERSIQLGKQGEVYNLTGQYFSLKDLARVLSEVSGQSIRPFIIPIPVMVCLLPFVGFFSFFMKRESTFTYQSLMTLKHGHKNMSFEKAKIDLGHNPRTLKESLQDLVQWFENEKTENDY